MELPATWVTVGEAGNAAAQSKTRAVVIGVMAEVRAGVLEGAAEREAMTAFFPVKVVPDNWNREIASLPACCAAVNAVEEESASRVSIPAVLVWTLRVIDDREAKVGDR